MPHVHLALAGTLFHCQYYFFFLSLLLLSLLSLLCRFTRLMQGAPAPAQQAKLQGLYMWGGVGVGKTMLMDLLAHSAPTSFQV